jgi:glycosyltransferase involved in cell wall biosynthesis
MGRRLGGVNGMKSECKTRQKNQIKILQIAGGFRSNVNGKAVSGGVPSFLNNYCSKVNFNSYTFDFMALRNQCFEPYRKQFEDNGWELYCLNLQSNGVKRAIQLISKLKEFLKENQYDVVHINMGSFFPVLCCAIAAKQAHVKRVIAHSHSSGIYSKRKRFIANIFTPFLTVYADEYCACSKLAAENLFSKRIIREEKYTIINNAIETSKFTYKQDVRDEVRHELGIKDEIIIGHVGRFVEVKNHNFLIDVFNEIKKYIPDAKLLLVGDGELKAEIERKVYELGLEKSVIFAGQRSDSYRFYQAMDLFILPSTVEGLGIVAIEAQASGLHCYVSSNVPEEVQITELCHFFDLKKGPVELATTVCKNKEYLAKRQDMSEQIISAGYDLNENVRIFETLYK